MSKEAVIQEVVFCRLCNENSAESPQLKFIQDKDADLVLCSSCCSLLNQACGNHDITPIMEQTETILKMPMPKEIFQFLNQHVVSQSKAKKVLATAVAHHFRRLQDPSIHKSNVLVMGPTGTGKTEMARSIAKFLNLPFVITDATTLTTRGYIGEDTESIVARLLQSANYNVKKAEQGIIFIDELDKLAKSQNKDSQVATVSVQQELLKIMEGSVLKLKGKNKEDILFDTKNILFICAGVFDGIEKSESVENKTIGFQADPQIVTLKSSKQVDVEQLVKFGMIPELMGRISVITNTELLSQDDLFKILTEPENSLVKQYTKLMKIDNVEVEFDQTFLMDISQEAFKNKLGARGVRKVLENHLGDLFFNIDEYDGKKVVVSKKITILDREVLKTVN